MACASVLWLARTEPDFVLAWVSGWLAPNLSGEMASNVSFRCPPVVETVLGVQFDRLKGLSNGQIGAFWTSLGPDWPTTSDAPKVEDQSERFGTPFSWGVPGIRIGPQTASRLQIKNVKGDRMIQVQESRIMYNWLACAEGEYPRYKNVRPDFDTVFRRFRDFVEERGFGPLVPNQWEITYVNQMPKGTVWNVPSDWASVFRGLPGAKRADDEVCLLEAFGGHWHFEIKPQRGRLHVDIQYGHGGQRQSPECVAMMLTARGPISKELPPQQAIDEGLNLGHEVIVTSFVDMTSDEAHKFWGKEQ